MWGMTAMKKGTSMKAKKKRAASTGTYPDVFSGDAWGVMSTEVNSYSTPNPNLHASVTIREVLIVGGAQLQVVNAAGGNVNNLAGNTNFTVSDYIATALRGESVVSLSNNPGAGSLNVVQPGVFYVQNVVNQGIHTRIVVNLQALTNGGNYNGGSSATTAVVNTASLTTSITNTPLAGNPPVGSANTIIDIDTSGLTSTTEIIFQVTVTGTSKVSGTNTSSTASASDISNGTALKTGSCYFKAIFV